MLINGNSSRASRQAFPKTDGLFLRKQQYFIIRTFVMDNKNIAR